MMAPANAVTLGKDELAEVHAYQELLKMEEEDEEEDDNMLNEVKGDGRKISKGAEK